ncbi:MAG TPA: choice-of-anchor Q domain-containing protein [Chitinophagaceae bacterium]|nr:choice-of-anchor Q domain-containing protein [Chitinophagaceae bacterium]
MKNLLVLFLIVALFSCKKDSFITSADALISITADTLHFDTVFTSTGSITQVFKIRNENNQKLRLDQVSLGGGNASFFKINVNGVTGPAVNNIEMEAKDSIYVFATITINPTADNLPFIVRDSIQVSFNGNTHYVQMDAYGQNAHFLRASAITGNVTWNNDLPYVLLDSLVVSPNATLTIEEGCRVYVHANTPVLVDGTLKINGKKYDSTRVRFKGDRLDEPYKAHPGSWPGIIFRSGSRDNTLNFTVLQNAYQGVVVNGPSINANPKLTLNQCIIDNISDAGIQGINTSITANNCIISNAGGKASNNVNLSHGGNYIFSNCTIVSYGNSYVSHTSPVLFLSNYKMNNGTKVPADLNAQFLNCIFWGENGIIDDEIMIERTGANPFSIAFTTCLWKMQRNPENATITSVINNQDPAFDSVDVARRFYNFRLKAGSPAIDKGWFTTNVIDLDGNPRAVGAFPDIGAYERQ